MSQISDGTSVCDEPRRLLGELLPLSACVAVGLVMATLPPMIQWFKLGHPIWIGNGDELFHLAVSSQAYYNHPSYLADPVFVSDGVSLFRQLPMLPGVWLARMFNLGPTGIDNCWRIFGGASLGVTWYLLIRQIIPNRWVGAAFTSVLLTDVGLLGSGLVFRQCNAITAAQGQFPVD